MQSLSTADYFSAQKAIQPGTAEFKELQEKKKNQAGLRKLLNGKVEKLIKEDMRYQ